MTFHIGLLLFPDITQLDMTGPYEVFTKFPDTKVHLIWKTRAPVTAGGGMQIIPTATFADCPQLDLICVPGGAGMNPLLTISRRSISSSVRRRLHATSRACAPVRWSSARLDC